MKYLMLHTVPLTSCDAMQQGLSPRVQSGELSENPQTQSQQNVEFLDSEAPAVDIQENTASSSGWNDADEKAHLGEYLSRPVKIHSFTWNESDTFTTSPILIHPWLLYFNSTYIKP